MSLIDRGDVFVADLPDAGPHPVVVVSRQEAIAYRSNVTVVLVTTTVRDHVAEVALDESHGLDHPSVANCDEVYTVPKRLLVRRRGRLDAGAQRALDRALRIALDL